MDSPVQPQRLKGSGKPEHYSASKDMIESSSISASTGTAMLKTIEVWLLQSRRCCDHPSRNWLNNMQSIGFCLTRHSVSRIEVSKYAATERDAMFLVPAVPVSN
jgi:hypothetical protein